MIVVADTPPINYLALIRQHELLEVLFGKVIIPPGVASELTSAGAPTLTREFILGHPAWLSIQAPSATSVDALRSSAIRRLSTADVEAICLAQELQADYLLTDDQDAREEAERRSVRVTGTLGVLVLAASRKLIDLHAAVNQLRSTGTFRMPEELVRRLLQDHSAPPT